jgi:LCP family protein required for cell wall assembly
MMWAPRGHMVTMGSFAENEVTVSEEEPREEEPRHKAAGPRRRRMRRVVIVLSVLLLVAASALLVAYKKLEGNINAVSITKQLGSDRPDEVKVAGPKRPLNVLVMGSDNRDGTKIGGDTPGLSDTTILLHLSADRKRAYGVSLPRDAMVDRPECLSKNGKKKIPGGVTQFNAAYAVGGPACTVKTVESLTNIRIDHFVVINFLGFKEMVNAIHGVTVCVPEEVNDDVGHIYLPKGTYKVNGNQALDYVRVRHDIGAPNGDIGRMKRQQSFIAAMVEKVVSKGTLANPVRLYKFLDAATKSLTTDTGFAHLKELASLGTSLKGIGLDNIQFVTVPNQPWPEDTNRLEWTPEAEALWRRIRFDNSLGKFGADAVTPGRKPGEKPTDTASASPSPGQSGSPSPSASPSKDPSADAAAERAARKEAAREAGLCA